MLLYSIAKQIKKGSDVDLTAVSARTVMCMLIRQMPLAVLLSHLASNQMQKNPKKQHIPAQFAEVLQKKKWQQNEQKESNLDEYKK